MIRLAPVLAFVAVLAACSGDDERLGKNEYLERIRGIAADSGRAVQLYTELVVRPRERSECAALAREFHEELEAILGRIEELRPPEEIDELHARFVGSARTSVERVGELADEVEDGETSCGQDYNRKAYGLPSTRRAEAVLEELERRGYVVRGD